MVSPGVPPRPSMDEPLSSVGWQPRSRWLGLNRPAHRTDPPGVQPFEPFVQPLAPAHSQVCRHLPPQTAHPVPGPGCVQPRRPAPVTQALQQCRPDHLNRSPKPPPVRGGPQAYHQTAVWTAVAPQRQRRVVTVKPGLDKPVSPQSHTAAAEADLRFRPGEGPAALCQGLDVDLDPMYQGPACGAGITSPSGAGARQRPPPTFTTSQKRKKPPSRRPQIIRTTALLVNPL